MGRRGPKPRPTEQAERDGAFITNPERRNKLEPEAPDGWPGMPTEISNDDDLRARWNQTCRHMEAMGTLSPVYGEAIGLYVNVAHHVAEINRKLHAEGYTPDMKSRHPLLPTYSQLAAQMQRLSAELGLTPSSKRGITVETKKTKGFLR